jgi:hypothetical protein
MSVSRFRGFSSVVLSWSIRLAHKALFQFVNALFNGAEAFVKSKIPRCKTSLDLLILDGQFLIHSLQNDGGLLCQQFLDLRKYAGLFILLWF